MPEAIGNYQFVTTNFFGQKSPQRKSASATIANPVELMNRTTMKTSRSLKWPHTVLKNEKVCTIKDRIKDKQKKWRFSET